MELPLVFTIIKKKFMANNILPDKDKKIICHILKKTFAECLDIENKLSESSQNGAVSDFDIMDFMGGFKNDKSK